MVNVCACWGCTNSSYSGHRVHRFPKQKHPAFRAWVRFVGVKRQDFTSSSVSNNSVICGAHFREEDYIEGDLTEHRMGFRNKDKIRLKSTAVPSVHSKRKKGKDLHRRGAAASAETITTMADPSSRRRNTGATAAHKLEVARMITDLMSQVETTGSPESMSGQKHSFTTVNHATRCGYRQLIYRSTDVQMMLLVKEEPPEEQNASKDQQDPDHLHIKEEQGELWTSLEEEQLQLKEEETDATRFPFATVSIKIEDDEEKLFSHLHQQQIEDKDVPTSCSVDQMTAETGGGAESSKNPDLNHHQQTTDFETEVSGDDDYVNQESSESFGCDDCGQIISYKTHLNIHMRVHTGQKPFACEVCGQRLGNKKNVITHMNFHKGHKP